MATFSTSISHQRHATISISSISVHFTRLLSLAADIDPRTYSTSSRLRVKV